MLTVHRKSYTRKDGTRVKSTTYRTKNLGKSGRGPKLFQLKKGGLSEYGYKPSYEMKKRHAALSSAISRGVSSLTLSRRLGALATLLKRTNPKLSKSLRRNQKWISRREF